FRVPTNARVSLGRLAVTMATAGAASSAFSVQDFQLDGQSVIGENIIDNAPKIGDQIHLWGIKDPALRATSGFLANEASAPVDLAAPLATPFQQLILLLNLQDSAPSNSLLNVLIDCMVYE